MRRGWVVEVMGFVRLLGRDLGAAGPAAHELRVGVAEVGEDGDAEEADDVKGDGVVGGGDTTTPSSMLTQGTEAHLLRSHALEVVFNNTPYVKTEGEGHQRRRWVLALER